MIEKRERSLGSSAAIIIVKLTRAAEDLRNPDHFSAYTRHPESSDLVCYSYYVQYNDVSYKVLRKIHFGPSIRTDSPVGT